MAIKYREHNGKEVKSYDFVSEVKALDDQTIEMIGSTEKQDRDGEVIKIEAWDLKAFNKNPVVLLNHNHQGLPIAKAKAKIDGKKLMFTIKFPNEEEGATEISETVRKLFKSGFMNASSVGFMPIAWDDRQKESDPWRTFTKVELLEISLVTVPANPQALVSGKSMQDAFKAKELDEKLVREVLGMDEGIEKQYTCSCVDCGKELKSEKHCKDIKCPECGGEMRRKERPGPGKELIDIDIQKLVKEEVTKQLKEIEEKKKEEQDLKLFETILDSDVGYKPKHTLSPELLAKTLDDVLNKINK